MDQIRIVADSSCDLLTLDGVDFVSVPLTVRTAAEEFRDDAALNVDAMISTLRGTKGRTFSACPNIADWESAFGESGDVLAFTITSSLSGSCSAALAAKKNCEERNPSRRIFVVDTLSAGPEIALLIEKAATGLRSGADFEEICTVVQQHQRRTHLIFALESMHNLAQNGRISKLAATMAGVLGIRAIGQASEEGTLEMLGKCRGARNTQGFLLSEMERLGYRGGSVRIGHCQNAAFALGLCTEIRRRFPEADVKSYPLRGLCSYYAERGGIMLGFES
jgi:DegV family protein with EDD domain